MMVPEDVPIITEQDLIPFFNVPFTIMANDIKDTAVAASTKSCDLVEGRFFSLNLQIKGN